MLRRRREAESPLRVRAMIGGGTAGAGKSPATERTGRRRLMDGMPGGGLRGAVVVITGASSGMGLATALAFARYGADVVLAARRHAPLAEAARACERAGGRAVAVPADVTDAADMHRLAGAAVDAFGRIDIWINNAGLSLWGAFEEIPVEAQARLVEVNLTGVINGSHAAVPHLLRAGGRGIIINMASIGGRLPMPWATTYTATKFGVAGFTEALRYELAAHSSIVVCAVYPAFVDTPTDVHSANYTGRALRPIPPVVDPEAVAERIVALAFRPRRIVPVGALHALAVPYALAPNLLGRLTGRLGRRWFMESGPRASDTDGTLFTPVAEGTGIRGGWGQPQRRRAGTATAALITLAAISAAAFAWRRRA